MSTCSGLAVMFTDWLHRRIFLRSFSLRMRGTLVYHFLFFFVYVVFTEVDLDHEHNSFNFTIPVYWPMKK